MIRQFFNSFIYLIGLIKVRPISAQEPVTINWSIAAELPAIDASLKNPGLAGVFAGIQKNVLIIGGGSNFSHGMPWEGGEKNYFRDVYVLQKGNGNKYNWVTTGKFKLKQKIAYGISVTIPGGIVCIGGENQNGPLKDVFLLQWDNSKKRIVTKDLPELPLPLTNSSGVAIGREIYVAGGETKSGVSDKFFFLNLNESPLGWKELLNIPKPLSHGIMVAQTVKKNNYIYLIGGRKKNENGVSDFSNSVFQFDLKKNIWTVKQPLPFPLSAGCGVTAGLNGIILIGGDKGEIFHQVEQLNEIIDKETDSSKKIALNQQKVKLQLNHPGFNKEIMFYNTIKDTWKDIGNFPFTPPATTTALVWNRDIIIPCGEIRAGVRTPQIFLGKLKFKK